MKSVTTNNDVKITAQDVKNLINAKMMEAAYKYQALDDEAKKTKALIEPLQLQIIQNNNYRYGDDEADELAGQPIKKLEHAWRMDDNDFQKYLDECDKLYKRLGFQIEKGYCPILIAEDEARKARKTLIDECQPILLGMTYQMLSKKIKHLEQATECLLQLLIL